MRARRSWDLLQPFDLRLCSQDVEQDVSPVRADEVEVEVEQSDLGRTALQDPRQAEQQVICQVGVPQNQLFHLI